MADYFIRTNKEDGTALIYTRIKKRNPCIRWEHVSTGVKVDIVSWTKAKKSTANWLKFVSTAYGKEICRKLDLITQTINVLFSEGKIKSKNDKGILEKELFAISNEDYYHEIHLKKEHEEQIKKEEQQIQLKKRKEIISYYHAFFQGISDGSIRHGNTKYSKGSIQVWKGFGLHLIDICPKHMTFDDVDKSFADSFSLKLENNGYLPTTINKLIICFRRLCNLAAEEGINTNAISLKVWKERTVRGKDQRTELYMTPDEIDALYKFELGGKDEQVRDIFLLGLFSAQRISDYSSLDRSNFTLTDNGTPIISLYQQKTGTYVEVPYVDERVNAICHKYDYSFPKIEQRDLNRRLKVIMRRLACDVPTLLELHTTVLTRPEIQKEKLYAEMTNTIRSGGKLSAERMKYYRTMEQYAEEHNGSPLFRRDSKGNVLMYKYELIVSHTARRTAITLLYKSGLLDTREMMAISGHKSEKVFEKYIKVGVSEQADKIYAKMKMLQHRSESKSQ